MEAVDRSRDQTLDEQGAEQARCKECFSGTVYRRRSQAAAERLIRLAAARGAQLALPELFNWRGKRSEEPAAAEALDGPTLIAMLGLHASFKIHLLAE